MRDECLRQWAWVGAGERDALGSWEWAEKSFEQKATKLTKGEIGGWSGVSTRWRHVTVGF